MTDNLKSTLKEVILITTGVLIALFVSNLKENYENEHYRKTSVEAVLNEVDDNYKSLEAVITVHKNLLDTLAAYKDGSDRVVDLFRKTNGMPFATLRNAGWEFYKRNQINNIDFELMSDLVHINILLDIIDTKLDKILDYAYTHTLERSEESKTVIMLHLANILDTETQLLGLYRKVSDNNGKGSTGDPDAKIPRGGNKSK